MRIGDPDLEAQAAPILSKEWLIGILVACLLAAITYQFRHMMARIDAHEKTVVAADHAVELLTQRVSAAEIELHNHRIAMMEGAKAMGKNEAEHRSMGDSIHYIGGALNQMVFGKLPNLGPHDGPRPDGK